MSWCCWFFQKFEAQKCIATIPPQNTIVHAEIVCLCDEANAATLIQTFFRKHRKNLLKIKKSYDFQNEFARETS